LQTYHRQHKMSERRGTDKVGSGHPSLLSRGLLRSVMRGRGRMWAEHCHTSELRRQVLGFVDRLLEEWSSTVKEVPQTCTHISWVLGWILGSTCFSGTQWGWTKTHACVTTNWKISELRGLDDIQILTSHRGIMSLNSQNIQMGQQQRLR
jgi:hypothetical protein